VRVLVTGAAGFIGKNVLAHLARVRDTQVLPITRASSLEDLERAVASCDFAIHLAGSNRPDTAADFVTGNVEFTHTLCAALTATGRRVPVIYASSIQATRDSDYGRSKLVAEATLQDYGRENGARVSIYRLPGVFGKWCRPNYNSVVATFCHNIARDLPIEVRDTEGSLNLVYVDDVAASFLETMQGKRTDEFVELQPVYTLTLGELAKHLNDFKSSRESLVIGRVGTGLLRALYATYLSYLPPQAFAYSVPQHVDPRGVFVEMLKTIDSGQFSYFTAHPGITRGVHYHHSKNEKFLVVKGKARFCFRQIATNERHELSVSSDQPQIVESIPGWSHDITNIGTEEMIVLLWANEIFDRSRPDTYSHPVQ